MKLGKIGNKLILILIFFIPFIWILSKKKKLDLINPFFLIILLMKIIASISLIMN